MLAFIPILAQTTTTAAKSSSSKGGSALFTFVPILLIGAAMYFLLIRPQRKRMRDQQSLMSKLEDGDEIITNGGIYGFITAIDGDVIWLDVGDAEHPVELRIHRSAVARKINPAVEPAGGEPVVEEAADEDDDDDKHKKKP